MSEITDQIVKAIDATGLTRADLARKLNITPQSITGWIRTGTINKRNLLALAELSKMKATDIISPNARKLYAVSNTDQDNALAKNGFDPHISDFRRLADAIEAVEAGLQTTNQMMEPADKAALIFAVYELLAEQNSTAKIFRLIVKGKV